MDEFDNTVWAMLWLKVNRCRSEAVSRGFCGLAVWWIVLAITDACHHRQTFPRITGCTFTGFSTCEMTLVLYESMLCGVA